MQQLIYSEEIFKNIMLIDFRFMSFIIAVSRIFKTICLFDKYN